MKFINRDNDLETLNFLEVNQAAERHKRKQHGIP